MCGALELVDEHPERNLTVSVFTLTVGVGAHGPQRGFADSMGMSPSTYVRSVRLDSVAPKLLTGASGRSVSDTASRWPHHLGRFARQHRHRFGVLTSGH